MGVEGDDRRPGTAGRRSTNEMLEQVGVSEMHAVEDADDDERRAERRTKGIHALDDMHARRQATGTPGSEAVGATNTLSGASLPPSALAIATSLPVASRSR